MIRRSFLALAVILAGCSRSNAAPSEASPRVLVGAGATLPFPLYSKWSAEYARVEPTVRVNYQSIGSGAGVRQLADGVVDFGATDAPGDVETPGGAKLVYVPTTIGAVVFAFNVPGLRALSLSGELAGDIFLGKVSTWDDARIRRENPGAELPSGAITVVHRADGSGTSAALTSYLAKENATWRTTVGTTTSPHFPVGVGAKGNEGVTAFVKSTPLAIGYVELVYARQAGLAMASVRNARGRMVAPSVESVDRAARSAPLPDAPDARIVLAAAEDEAAYPIAALSFVVVPRDLPGRAKGEALARFLWWGVHEGQSFARALDYAQLPPAIVERAERRLGELRADGRPLLPPGG
ncbi:MAG: Phosphate-binding protein PstS [Labilithrix sp.]|nr:Phosphate-binding protein PstS [Labilithrix sp.]